MYDGILFEKALRKRAKRKKDAEISKPALTLESIKTDNAFVVSVLKGVSRRGVDFLSTVDWYGQSEEDLNAFEATIEKLMEARGPRRHFGQGEGFDLEKYCKFVEQLKTVKPSAGNMGSLLLF